MKILAINLPNLNLEYFKKKGLEFDVKHINLELNVPLKFLYNFNGQDFYTPDLQDTLNIKFPKFEQSFILYGYTSNDPKNSTGGYAYFDKLNSGARWASVRIDGNENKYAVHELHHLICNVINIDFKDITPKDFMDRTPVGNPPIWINYYLNHDPENPESNHGRTWANIIPFLPKLKAITYNTGYRYFSKKEAENMTPEFMEFADELRHRLGFPLAETSGFRTPAENKRVGGVADSPHLFGKGKDWKVSGGERKYQFTEEAQKLAKEKGKIIGIGTGYTFMHLDVGHRGQNTMWNYK
jgi:uncharacterized protein YcbK (DUF882 family)